jgi:hypothetical protein
MGVPARRPGLNKMPAASSAGGSSELETLQFIDLSRRPCRNARAIDERPEAPSYSSRIEPSDRQRHQPHRRRATPSPPT